MPRLHWNELMSQDEEYNKGLGRTVIGYVCHSVLGEPHQLHVEMCDIILYALLPCDDVDSVVGPLRR